MHLTNIYIYFTGLEKHKINKIPKTPRSHSQSENYVPGHLESKKEKIIFFHSCTEGDEMHFLYTNTDEMLKTFQLQKDLRFFLERNNSGSYIRFTTLSPVANYLSVKHTYLLAWELLFLTHKNKADVGNFGNSIHL